MKIDADEKELLEIVERGEWKAARRGKRGRTPFDRSQRPPVPSLCFAPRPATAFFEPGRRSVALARDRLLLVVCFCSGRIPDISFSITARTGGKEVERGSVFGKPGRTIIELAVYRTSQVLGH